MKRRRRSQTAWMQSANSFRKRVAIREQGREAERLRVRELADVRECALADMSPFADTKRRRLTREVDL